MEKLYDRADIYDLLQTQRKDELTKEHWQAILSDKPIHSLLDVSIGSGNLALPLLDLGITLYGSDLSECMLQKCQQKAIARNGAIDLRISDFRKLTSAFSCCQHGQQLALCRFQFAVYI